MSAIYTKDGVANVYANRTKMVCLFAKNFALQTYIIYRSDSMKRITIAIVVALFAFASFAQEVNGTSNRGGVLNEQSIT